MKIKAWAQVYPTENILDIPDEDLRDLSPSEREAVIYEYVDSWVNGIISSGYEVLEPVNEEKP